MSDFLFSTYPHRELPTVQLEKKYPIGLGVTEAACKTLVKQRLCCSGMRWKEKGAGIILSLRALVLTRNDGVNFGQNLISMGFL
jgi:hypothetical protein